MATRLKHSYRLLIGDEAGEARRVEFEGYDATLALHLAQRETPGREIRIFEDDRPVGTLRYAPQGYWTLGSEPAAAPGRAPPARRGAGRAG